MSDIIRSWRHIQQRYNLIGSKCTNCDGVYFPPRVICPKCRRKGNIENIQFSGKGKIHSFSIVETPTDDFKTIAPYAVAIIELEEGAKLTSQLVECDLDEIEIGDPVEMVFRKIREDGDDGVISYGFKFKPVK
ncbi:Zn-ribbon domain-containing OB-fold protein [Methanobrevibacter sp. TMH8]|uniref:Zn-ribbon domain-containing OB-fold protein n=1 Tax=Methanobrevibacter sp. TMH8 TaxID=2848611 RepID=UPI001CCE1126|nr:Zn-ribbon domain-containing OB-fold protein [Methanobrevibacter sp. TMH8]MBZ9570468.1 Zn-ribbon domain-containing OB-fold protein [Methanobrevibacter sp. TMH8]